MKKIIIDEKHAEKIAAVLETVQKRAKVRTITTEQVLDLPGTLYRFYGVPKSRMNGLKLIIDFNAQNFPNAYKYTPESTIINVEFSATKCYLTSVERSRTQPENKFFEADEMPEALKDALLDKYMKNTCYNVH